MKINNEYFKPFPNYEDVFYDDIENHKKYFLPICSVHLKCIDPNRDEWVHFISTKEINGIFDLPIGEFTEEYHTQYTARDMISFDIIDGKYKFEADWKYFYINHEYLIPKNKKIIEDFQKHNFEILHYSNQWIDDLNCTKILKDYLKLLAKEKQENNINDYLDIPMYELVLNDIQTTFIKKSTFRELAKDYEKNNKWFNQVKEKFAKNPIVDDEAEYFGFIKDLKFQSKAEQESLREYNITLEQAHKNLKDDLMICPIDEQGNMFEYIGELTGFYFQEYGADELIAFQNKELKKATMVLSYS